MRRRGRAQENWGGDVGHWFCVVLCGKLAEKVLSEAKVTNLGLAYFELKSKNKGGKIILGCHCEKGTLTILARDQNQAGQTAPKKGGRFE